MSEKIPWRDSDARKIVLFDLNKGYLPLSSSKMSALEAWTKVYMHLKEFKDVPYEQFRDRLRDHRKQGQRLLNKASSDEIDLYTDRILFPRKLVNSRNELVFDLSPAKAKLREDIDNKKHEKMTLHELWSSRCVYRLFEQKIFYERIKQELRRRKCINYKQLKQAKDDLLYYDPSE